MFTNSTRQTLGAASFSFMIRDRVLSLPLYYDTAENRTDLSIIMLFVGKYHIYRALELTFLRVLPGRSDAHRLHRIVLDKE
jgi:hypothetical protein